MVSGQWSVISGQFGKVGVYRLPGPQRRGTGGTLSFWLWDQGHPPEAAFGVVEIGVFGDRVVDHVAAGVVSQDGRDRLIGSRGVKDIAGGWEGGRWSAIIWVAAPVRGLAVAEGVVAPIRLRSGIIVADARSAGGQPLRAGQPVEVIVTVGPGAHR